MLGAATRDRTVKDHMPMTEGVECARKLKPGRTLFTHVGHRIGTHAELEAWVPEGFGIATTGSRSSSQNGQRVNATSGLKRRDQVQRVSCVRRHPWTMVADRARRREPRWTRCHH